MVVVPAISPCLSRVSGTVHVPSPLVVGVLLSLFSCDCLFRTQTHNLEAVY